MAGLLPVAVYGLKVPAGEVLIEATTIPATFRVTMAAIDPSADTSESSSPARSTLKMLYERPKRILDDSDDSEDDDEAAFLKALRNEIGSDDDDSDESSDDEDKNGGPSDPSKSVKARKEAAATSLLNSLIANGSDDDSDEDMDMGGLPKSNGLSRASTKDKGKGKASLADPEEDDSDIDADDLETVVLCTLDPSKTYQQPIDIVVHDDQRTFFKVSGTHAVYLSGNYVIAPDDPREDRDEDDDDYDLSPDEDELDLDGDESDELDDVEDPRIVELGSDDEEEAPKLVKDEATTQPKKQKGKNKRPAEESDSEDTKPVNIDDLISKVFKTEDPATNGDAKLSKKQLKKLKNNAGKPVEAQTDETDKKPEVPAKSDKKVQFAKNLETGPSHSPSAQLNGAVKSASKDQSEQPKATTGVKFVQGVKIDDKKLGSGPQAKKGDTLGMRYIGKLSTGKVFDANKKGAPFRFKLGAGDVIKGWDIGVSGMSVQGERRIVVPAQLGYGNKGMPGIPANSELTFDIKLLEISKK